ncbi:hypothetical protein RclHR1_15340004 [Rhizophagus clarus]|uniref:Protein kinase domain-containing protein n=1 Tax=Rhizophagus clarus TaxID=94130 RepID=A0A2Z6R7I3_9GLOM|nr:hypothetical protein RclHR1_15340004 [Rhizophagus clarus]
MSNNKVKTKFYKLDRGNEKIDELIQELQLKINRHDDIIVEWIHYNRFNDIKEINKDDIATLYSATWMDGQLKYKNNKKEKVRVKSYYSIYRFDYYILKIYGISQNPETRDYIIVFQEVYCETCSKICTDLRRCWRSPCKINNLKQNFTNWTSGNEKIDEFIQEMQLKINRYDDKVTPLLGNRSYFHLFVSYSKYLNGPSIHIAEYNVAVSSLLISLILLNRLYGIHSTILRCVNGSQKFIDEAKGYSIDDHEYDVPHIYGITQNADTKDYIIVLDDRYCKNCVNDLKKNFANWTSGNDKIDEFIQEMQMRINGFDDITVEWIPYNQFNNIKEVGKGGAIWKDGPFIYHYDNNIKKYSIKHNDNILQIYGISQNPDTKDYIMVLEYANGGNFNSYINNYAVNWSLIERLDALEKYN